MSFGSHVSADMGLFWGSLWMARGGDAGREGWLGTCQESGILPVKRTSVLIKNRCSRRHKALRLSGFWGLENHVAHPLSSGDGIDTCESWERQNLKNEQREERAAHRSFLTNVQRGERKVRAPAQPYCPPQHLLAILLLLLSSSSSSLPRDLTTSPASPSQPRKRAVCCPWSRHGEPHLRAAVYTRTLWWAALCGLPSTIHSLSGLHALKKLANCTCGPPFTLPLVSHTLWSSVYNSSLAS